MDRSRWFALVAVVIWGGLCVVAVARGQQTEQMPLAEARERNVRAYVELLRRDIRTQKAALITQMMAFTDAEDKAFWPIYREFEVELSKLNDQRLKLIADYSEAYTRLTDAQADDLATKALDLEARRTALKQKYYTNLKAALPARVALKVVYIEQQLDLLVNLQIAASLPVVNVTTK